MTVSADRRPGRPGSCSAPARAPAAATRRCTQPDYLPRGNGARSRSLDPHYIDGTWEANIVGDALVGLTTDAADGSPMAGVAFTGPGETSA